MVNINIVLEVVTISRKSVISTAGITHHREYLCRNTTTAVAMMKKALGNPGIAITSHNLPSEIFDMLVT